MSKNILVFGGSTSSTSINKQLANYASSFLENINVNVIDLSVFDIPVFSVDQEKEGVPESIMELSKMFKHTDGFIISLAEHNGSYAAGYKNIIDWISRVEKKVFHDKPVLLMATSPGARGGITVLQTAKNYYPYMGANIVGSFSLPSFTSNFQDGKIVDKDLASKLEIEVTKFKKELNLN